MNYIESLQARNSELEERLARINRDLTHLVCYLHSSKFSDDTTIQVKDVLNWLRDPRLECAEFDYERLHD